MGGVLAIVGLERADAVVRASAQPLLRRPWHRLDVVSSPADRVALGFAGERGGVSVDPATGVLVALDGELRDETGTCTASEQLLAAYLADGSNLEPPDGYFAAAVWDPRAQTLVLITDRVGSRPLFVARKGSALVAAGELKALVRAGITPELDVDGWAQLLAYEQLLGDSTPLAGVRIVPPGTALTMSATGGETASEYWRYRVEPGENRHDAEIEEEFARLLDRAFRRGNGGRLALALSGGLDSRCLATVATPGVVAATFGMSGSEELELAQKVAAGASIEHRVLELEPGYVARNAEATVWLTEGQIRCFHSHHLALGALRSSEQLETVAIGFAGDAVMRWGDAPAGMGESAMVDALDRDLACALSEPLADELLTARFADALRGRARSSLARALSDEDGDAVARRNQICMRQIYRRKVLPGAALFLDDVALRDPYTDAALIDLCRRMPHRLRADGRLQRAYLRRFSSLARIRNPKDGIAPSLEGRRRSAARQIVLARQRSRRLAELTFRPARWRRRGGLGDYAADLRRGGSSILDVLLEPRTLGRGQLRKEPVRRLVTATRSGRSRDAQVVGMLLTLELFQRQFVDGDEPASLETRRAVMLA